MPEALRPTFRTVVMAIAASLCAAGLRYVCVAWLGVRAPLLILHAAAVALVAQYLGTVAGAVATAASFSLILIQLSPGPDPVTLIVFLLLGAALSYFGGARLRTERQLRRIHSNLETAQHIANIGSWERAPSGKLWWSPETCNIFGVPPGTELTRADFFDLVHPDDRGAVRQAADTAVKTGTDYDLEHRIVRKSDGQVRYVHQRAKVFRNGVVTMIGSIQDITEMRRTRDELARTSRIMADALDAGNSGAWLWDLETGELSWSESYYRVLGVERAVKPSSELFYSLVHPGDLKRLKRSNEDAIAGRVQEFRDEFRIQVPEGVRWLERRGRVIFNDRQKPVCLIGITTDVSERRVLRGLLPACAQCKKIRDEQGQWQALERYLSDHSEARLSHGLCPDCQKQWMEAEGVRDS